MPKDLDRRIGGRGRLDGGVAAAGASGWRGWLIRHAWRGLAAAAIFVGLCVAFGGDKPQSSAKAKLSLAGDFGLVEAINFATDGETLLSSSWDKTVRVWEVGGAPTYFGEELARLPVPAEVYEAVMSPDCRTAAIAGTSGVTLWDWRDAEGPPVVVADLGLSRSLAFSADGRSLFVGGGDGKVRRLDLRSLRFSTLFGGHADMVRSLWAAPDDSLLIALGYNGDLTFWDQRSKRLVDGIDGSATGVLAASMSPDGKTLAITRQWGGPGAIELWDLGTGRLRARCQGHEGMTHAMTFSRDGATLASTGDDLRIRFWNVATGRGVGKINDPGGWVRVLRFSADGRWLAYSGDRNRVQFHRVAFPGLAAGPASPAGRVTDAAPGDWRRARRLRGDSTSPEIVRPGPALVLR